MSNLENTLYTVEKNDKKLPLAKSNGIILQKEVERNNNSSLKPIDPEKSIEVPTNLNIIH